MHRNTWVPEINRSQPQKSQLKKLWWVILAKETLTVNTATSFFMQKNKVLKFIKNSNPHLYSASKVIFPEAPTLLTEYKFPTRLLTKVQRKDG